MLALDDICGGTGVNEEWESRARVQQNRPRCRTPELNSVSLLSSEGPQGGGGTQRPARTAADRRRQHPLSDRPSAFVTLSPFTRITSSTMTATKINGATNGSSDQTYPLPTTGRLGIAFPSAVDPAQVAEAWLAGLSKTSGSLADPVQFSHSFIADGWWKDRAALTWDYRTFHSTETIYKAANVTFAESLPRAFKLSITPPAEIQQPYPDLGYIQAHFTFETQVGLCSGVVNLVATVDGFRAWTISTVLESLKDFPELERPDGHLNSTESWSNTRAKKAVFEDEDPEVVIVGAGHNGLVLAARLQAIGVKVLVVDRNARVGDNWRNRYESLSLHFPVWQDHLPYIPFPKQWPVYTPAGKIANWLESYADSLDLNVWTSAKVTAATFDAAAQRWSVSVQRGEHTRQLSASHFVVATGLAGTPSIPTIPEMESFTGTIRHSSAHDSAKHWQGKKILVVGTSSSGFDSALDAVRNGVDVTMLQRSPTYVMSLTHGAPACLGTIYSESGPPIDVADRIGHAMPVIAGEELARRMTSEVAEKDKDLIAGLKKAGFNWYSGIKGTGTVLLGWERAGGFYYDAGACSAVIDGRIKMKQGTISEFAGDQVVFSDGTSQHYDLVVLATGYTDVKEPLLSILGPDVGSRVKRVWGLDKEGELNGVWRDMGVDGLWVMVGTFGWARFHSKIVANQIKAKLEGIAGQRYSA